MKNKSSFLVVGGLCCVTYLMPTCIEGVVIERARQLPFEVNEQGQPQKAEPKRSLFKPTSSDMQLELKVSTASILAMLTLSCLIHVATDRKPLFRRIYEAGEAAIMSLGVTALLATWCVMITSLLTYDGDFHFHLFSWLFVLGWIARGIFCAYLHDPRQVKAST